MQIHFNYQQPVNDVLQFYGRKALINKIYSRIGASRPQSVSIVGDYKAGKTSLLKYLSHPSVQKQYLDDAGNYCCLFIPVHEKGKSFEDFVSYLCKAVSQLVKLDFEYTSIIDSYNWLKHLVETKTSENKKFIFFMDDFNLITQNEEFPLEFFSFLRSLANNFNVAYVTSSYLDLQQLCVSKDIEESPFFNIFTNITMRPFHQEEAHSFLLNFNSNGNELSESEKEMVYSYTGTFPFLLQLAGVIYFENEDNDGFSEEQFKKDFCARSNDFFNKIWEQLEEDNKRLMVQIISSKKIKADQNYLLQELIQKNYIYLKDKKLYIFSPAFSQFIRAQNNNGSANFFSKIIKLFKRKRK